jgi:urate oxidase
MPLVSNRYGKGRVRVMRVDRSGGQHEVRELDIKVMVEGDFARAYTNADNSRLLSTDTMKNVVNVVAREQLGLDKELFCGAVADKLFECYRQIEAVTLSAAETKWNRLSFAGRSHPHSFVLDANGKPSVVMKATRTTRSISSGITGFTFMKSTGSGWDNFARDPYTTLVETKDRICATSMDASWTWSQTPADYPGANERILSTMIEVFATTYSAGVQDSMYRMGEAALAATPEVSSINLACPNKHYLPINLSSFDLDNANQVFVPTDEPHGQIECTVAR